MPKHIVISLNVLLFSCYILYYIFRACFCNARSLDSVAKCGDLARNDRTGMARGSQVSCLFFRRGARATNYQTLHAFRRTIGCPALHPNAC